MADYTYEELKTKTVAELREIAKGIDHEAVQATHLLDLPIHPLDERNAGDRQERLARQAHRAIAGRDRREDRRHRFRAAGGDLCLGGHL